MYKKPNKQMKVFLKALVITLAVLTLFALGFFLAQYIFG